MRQKIIITLIVILSYNNFYAQEKSGINWRSIHQLDSLLAKGDRPVLIDTYTDWCSWCKHMNKTTFSTPGIIKYINNNFYAIKFDAETTDTIKFKDKIYVNNKGARRSAHDFAKELLDGRLSYPTIVYFDRKGKKTVVPGYKKTSDIEYFLVYFAENVGQNASLDNFVLNYVYSFADSYKKNREFFKIKKSQKPDTTGKVDWIKSDSIMAMSKEKKKPIFVYFYTSWCISCKVMDKTSFGNSKLAELLNENYYSVKINAANENEINFLGKTYKGTGVNSPNEIVKTFFNNYQMPAVLIFDENYKLISRINGYLLSEQLIPLTTFFYKKLYNKMSFQEYMKQQK